MKMLVTVTVFILSIFVHSAFAEECRMRVDVAAQRTNGTFFQNMRHPDFPQIIVSQKKTWEACYRRSLHFAKANRIGGETRIQLGSMAFGRANTYGQPYVYWSFKTGHFSSIKGALTEYSDEKPAIGDKRRTEHGDRLLGKVRF